MLRENGTGRDVLQLCVTSSFFLNTRTQNVGKESLENSEILDFILIENIAQFYTIFWKKGQECLPAWEANRKDIRRKTVRDMLRNAGAYP